MQSWQALGDSKCPSLLVLKFHMLVIKKKITPYITHKVITCLSVFSFEGEEYSTEVLKSVKERLTSSNKLICE